MQDKSTGKPGSLSTMQLKKYLTLFEKMLTRCLNLTLACLQNNQTESLPILARKLERKFST